MRYLDLDEIHKVTLDVVKKIISICEEQNITYYTMYGSLIGAVRHKGFIPWDDDFDIIMLRPDYDRFMQYCIENSEALYPYKLINRNTSKDYAFNISRFCDCRYEMIRDNNEPSAGMGIFVDIYPFDGLGNSATKIREETLVKKQALLYAISWAGSSKWFSDSLIKNLIKIPLSLLFHMSGKNYWLNRLKKFREKNSVDDSKYVGCVVWDAGMVFFEKKWFSKTKLMDFEDIKVTVPYNYHEVLVTSYGNYMELPPKEAQVPTHAYKIVKKDACD